MKLEKTTGRLGLLTKLIIEARDTFEEAELLRIYEHLWKNFIASSFEDLEALSSSPKEELSADH
jgi:hypothetical protein